MITKVFESFDNLLKKYIVKHKIKTENKATQETTRTPIEYLECSKLDTSNDTTTESILKIRDIVVEVPQKLVFVICNADASI